MFLLYKKQSIDLHSKSVDWFLYDGNISRAWIKLFSAFSTIVKYFKLPEQNQPRLGHLAEIGRRKICRGGGEGGGTMKKRKKKFDVIISLLGKNYSWQIITQIMLS